MWFILGAFLFCVLTWVMYLSIMNLIEQRDNLTLPAKVIAYPIALVGVLMDFTLNVVIGTILFLEPPTTWLFTGRLQRHIGKPTWRAKQACWICKHFLDPFDSRGYHCRKPPEPPNEA